jgi:Ser/Thr protein kinase RdoA (MazF antagonist)
MFYWQVDRKITPSQIKNIFLDRKSLFDPILTKKAIVYAMIASGKSAEQSQVVDIGKPISFGSINNAVPATIADGTEIIIRMHPHEVKNGYFWVEKLAAKKAMDAGAPSFRTYFIYDDRRKFDFDFMVMERLPGKTMQSLWPIEKELDARLIKETGKNMALIHTVKTDGFGFFSNSKAKNDNKLIGQYNNFAGHFFSSFEENLKSLVDYRVVDTEKSRRIKRIFDNNVGLLKIKKASLIHNDVADWNELVYDGHISGFIDWDECIGGDPVMDFAQWSLFFDENRLGHLKEGYMEVLPLPDNFEEKLHLYKLRYMVSKMVLRMKRLSVDPHNEVLTKVIKRGYDVMKEEFDHYAI